MDVGVILLTTIVSANPPTPGSVCCHGKLHSEQHCNPSSWPLMDQHHCPTDAPSNWQKRTKYIMAAWHKMIFPNMFSIRSHLWITVRLSRLDQESRDSQVRLLCLILVVLMVAGKMTINSKKVQRCFDDKHVPKERTPSCIDANIKLCLLNSWYVNQNIKKMMSKETLFMFDISEGGRRRTNLLKAWEAAQ